MDYGQDNYTTPTNVQTYLGRTLTAQENGILVYVIPAASRWIDDALGTIFDDVVTNGTGVTSRQYRGGFQRINIDPCQSISAVQAINPYNNTVWYTYSTPLEYIQEPYNLPVKTELIMRVNEFTGNNLDWPGGDISIRVTGLFTSYDYVHNQIPFDIQMLVNHISSVFMQNYQNTDVFVREGIEGFVAQKNMNNMNDILKDDPMVTRILAKYERIWLED